MLVGSSGGVSARAACVGQCPDHNTAEFRARKERAGFPAFAREVEENVTPAAGRNTSLPYDFSHDVGR